MEVRNIILFVIIGVLLIIVVNYVMKDASTLTGLTSSQTLQRIDVSSLATSLVGGNTSNYTYSIWFFIDDWNYRYGESKVIFGRMGEKGGKKEPCPVVKLGPVQNNITVSLAVYPGLDDVPDKSSNSIIHDCSISNVPIQKWCNLFISAYGRTLDMYLDGKLVRTCVLPGVSKVDGTAPIYITPMGGFSGWTARFQYWPNSSDPQKAWNVYQSGYGNSWLGSLFGRYNVKVAILDGNSEETSFTI